MLHLGFLDFFLGCPSAATAELDEGFVDMAKKPNVTKITEQLGQRD